MSGLALGVYPVAVFPDNPAFLYVGGAVVLFAVLAAIFSSWLSLSVAAVTAVIGYMAVLIIERGRIDVFAPVMGVVLVLFIEFFDVSVAASRRRSMDRFATAARLKDLAPGLGAGILAGMIVLFAGVYGGDGGVIILGLGAAAVVVVFALLATAARSAPE